MKKLLLFLFGLHFYIINLYSRRSSIPNSIFEEWCTHLNTELWGQFLWQAGHSDNTSKSFYLNSQAKTYATGIIINVYDTILQEFIKLISMHQFQVEFISIN
ncbi:MAG: hypothetical protein P8Z35_26290 [Ignavibacteriaceae bacterium]